VLIRDLENEVGDAIKASGVPRKDIFITSKVFVAKPINREIKLMLLQMEYLPSQRCRIAREDPGVAPDGLPRFVPDSLASVSCFQKHVTPNYDI
jgi:hypothetical protein